MVNGLALGSVLKRCNHRAADVAAVLVAAINQALQCAFDAAQIAKLLAHIDELDMRQGSSLITVRAVLQHQQGGHFVKAETQALRRLDETHPRHIVRTVAPNAALGPRWLFQQTFALVEADRLDTDLGQGGCGADRELFCSSFHALDSVLRYGSKLSAMDAQLANLSKEEAQRGRSALAAGGLAALLASACCLGPLLLLSLGFSGAWIANLTALEPYRPIFVGLALLALFLAGRRIFRPVAECKPDDACLVPGARTAYKVVFWAVAALVFVGLVFPWIAPWFY